MRCVRVCGARARACGLGWCDAGQGDVARDDSVRDSQVRLTVGMTMSMMGRVRVEMMGGWVYDDDDGCRASGTTTTDVVRCQVR